MLVVAQMGRAFQVHIFPLRRFHEIIFIIPEMLPEQPPQESMPVFAFAVTPIVFEPGSFNPSPKLSGRFVIILAILILIYASVQTPVNTFLQIFCHSDETCLTGCRRILEKNRIMTEEQIRKDLEDSLSKDQMAAVTVRL